MYEETPQENAGYSMLMESLCGENNEHLSVVLFSDLDLIGIDRKYVVWTYNRQSGSFFDGKYTTDHSLALVEFGNRQSRYGEKEKGSDMPAELTATEWDKNSKKLEDLKTGTKFTGTMTDTVYMATNVYRGEKRYVVADDGCLSLMSLYKNIAIYL